jgi:glutathione peroxidase-family protein
MLSVVKRNLLKFLVEQKYKTGKRFERRVNPVSSNGSKTGG